MKIPVIKKKNILFKTILAQLLKDTLKLVISISQGWLSPRLKYMSPLGRGEIPFCQREMAETGEKLPDVFILRCKA